jgi:hypothetical protein
MRKRLFFLMLLCLSIGSEVFSQGVTTASLSGSVSDEKGEVVMMANVLAVHTPSGTQYATTTMEDGRFHYRICVLAVRIR